MVKRPRWRLTFRRRPYTRRSARIVEYVHMRVFPVVLALNLVCGTFDVGWGLPAALAGALLVLAAQMWLGACPLTVWSDWLERRVQPGHDYISRSAVYRVYGRRRYLWRPAALGAAALAVLIVLPGTQLPGLM